MRSWLNNPWAVGVLIVSAIMVITINVALPIQDVGQPDTAPAFQGMELTNLQEIEVVPVVTDFPHLVFQTDWEGLAWQETMARDPFQLTRSYVSSTIEKNGQQSVVFPAVTAIVSGPVSSYAVIGDQLIEVGDMVSGYSVERISSDAVFLQRKSHEVSLMFEGKMQEEK